MSYSVKILADQEGVTSALLKNNAGIYPSSRAAADSLVSTKTCLRGSRM